MHILIIVILTLLPTILIAQEDPHNPAIFLGYNSTDSGRSFSASYVRERTNNDWGVGLGMNIRRKAQPDNFNHLYRKRLYPLQPIHFLALNTFYHHHILKRLEHIQPFAFYDLQVRYAPTRTESTVESGIDTVRMDYYYSRYIFNFGPYCWAESTIGVGFKVELTKRLLFQQKVGMGINLIMGWGNFAIHPKRFVEWEAAHLLQFGLVYRLN